MNPTLIAAVYTFAAHFHSGQDSRGYRLLCEAGRAWRRHAGIDPRLGYWEGVVRHEPDHPLSRIYWALAHKYGNEV